MAYATSLTKIIIILSIIPFPPIVQLGQSEDFLIDILKIIVENLILAEEKEYIFELIHDNYYPKFAMYLNFLNT